MIAKGQITVTNLDDGKTPFLHQAYKMKDGRFLKHYPVYEASPVNGYKEGDLWHRTDGSQPGYFVANKSNTTLNLNDWTFYANELAYSDTDKFYPKFEGTYSDYNEVASDDQTKYTWKIIKADDGIGIKSVKEYYATSTSNVTPPSSWSETPKTTDTTNKYLWNYEVYTYSNGDVKETTKRVIGTHGTTGATGATGSTGNGITSVTNRYLATTLATGVTTATSGWTTTVQATDSVKKYLWNYEEILYTNGTKIPTNPVIIGTHGEKGDNSVTGLLTNESITLPANKDGLVSASSFTGATGIFDVYDGITKKTGSGVTYSLVSQSNITVTINATTGAYSVTAMPTGTTILNGYAVLRAIYNGVTIEKQLNVSKSVTGATGATGPQGATGATGSRGPTGATGTSVSSVTEYYLATSESSGIVSTDTRFTTAIQTMTATNKYLWNYEKINFSDGTSQPTIPVIIGVYGDKGQTGSTGATGRSITSITEHYLATSVSSGVTRSTSGWSTAMQPTTPTNKYLWNYETVNWSSGTTPTYVEPIIIGVHGDKGDKGDSGKDGIAGKDGKGISSTTITYGLSTTDTVEPTNYTSNVPTLVKGQYLWTKTVWKYTDNTTETGYTKTYIAKDGNNGTDGIAGKDGVGISNTKVEYVGSTSGTVTPTSGWNTAVPTVAEGNFLWTRTTWTYTDNTTETGYSVAKMGAKGATGATGSTGAPGVSSYTWIRYSPNADGSSMTPTPAANSLYIGVAITSANSAPTAYTAYTWALIKGADGKGVKSAVVTYQASTSGTVIPTGSWVTTIPTVPKGQYLWTRVVTTYTDNSTSTSYSASYQGVDGITNVTGLLTNESITLPANVGGTVTTYTGATGTFEVFEGLTKKTGTGVTYSVLSKTNIEVNIATTGVYTITSMTSGTTVLNGFATLRAIYNGVTIDKQISVTKAVTGATGATGGTGATGASATSYWITASNNIIGKSQTGVINPTTITFKGFSKTGTANPVAYSGRFIIQTSTNGTTYTNSYVSNNINESSYTYTIPANSLFVKCLFYMAGGTTVLLDEQTVPIVESAEGIQVGGENLISKNNTTYRYGTLTNTSSEKLTGSGRWFVDFLPNFEPNTTYTLSNSGIKNTGARGQVLNVLIYNGAIQTLVQTLPSMSSAGKSTFTTNSAVLPTDRLLVYISDGTTVADFEISKLKLEKGTVATDWRPHPEDARTYKAWANSSDGGADFTRVYPNENLIAKADIIERSYINATGAVSPLANTFTTEKIEVASGVEYTIKNHSAHSGKGVRIIEYNSSGAMTKYDNVFYGVGTVKLASTTTHVRVNVDTPDGTYSNDAKLEQGTTPTIYTTNPSDSLTGSVPKYVGFSPLDSNKPSDYEWIINPEWTESSSMEYTSSKIEQTSESIMTTVTESFVADEDYTKYREDVATQFQQTATDFNLLFSTVSEEVKKVESGSETKFEKIEKYIRFVDGKIVLGTSDSDSVLEISNDRISFKQGGNEVAHFAGQTFTISKGILTDSMQVGDHRMTKNAGGLTTFDYIP